MPYATPARSFDECECKVCGNTRRPNPGLLRMQIGKRGLRVDRPSKSVFWRRGRRAGDAPRVPGLAGGIASAKKGRSIVVGGEGARMGPGPAASGEVPTACPLRQSGQACVTLVSRIKSRSCSRGCTARARTAGSGSRFASEKNFDGPLAAARVPSRASRSAPSTTEAQVDPAERVDRHADLDRGALALAPGDRHEAEVRADRGV